MTLKGDEDGCGCVVKSVLNGGAVGLDGRIGVGDHICAVNDESMIGLSSHRARYLLVLKFYIKLFPVSKHRLMGRDQSH